ncbi:MAG: HPr family phosphocarrier protein [Cardiobacteriaceae bacterium]|nr:HPr family phosphocarrier protein [Cardiobacteriaceae bacterium]
MQTTELVLNNDSGLHARPGKDFVQLAKTFESVVTVIKNGERYNGKSLMKIMQAGLSKGDTFQIETEGADEEKALAALADYIGNLRE